MRKESLLDNPRAAVDKQVSPPRGARLHNLTYEKGKFVARNHETGGVLYTAEPRSDEDIETVQRVGPDHKKAHRGNCRPEMVERTDRAFPDYVQGHQ